MLRADASTELNILQLRKEESLTADMKSVIKLLTLDPENPAKMVGSFRYKVHEYPSDIDLYEDVNACCTLQESAEKIATRVQTMIKGLQKRRFTYLADFKAGIDDRYVVDIGHYDVETNTLSGYDQFHIMDQIGALYIRQLLTKEEAVEIIRMIPAHPSAYNYQKLRDAIRQHYILRWNAKELLQGYKNLRQGKTIRLVDALQQNTIVKIDLWALVDDRFMEVTNWYMLIAHENGKAIYLSEKPEDYQESLRKEIMLFKKPDFKKHMKLAKRMWLYAISIQDHDTIRKLYPLFSSPIAKLNQIQSEMEILIGMLEKLPRPPYFLMRKQMALFKTRISTVPDVYMDGETETAIFQHLDRARHSVDDHEKMADHLAKAREMLQEIVDKQAKRYMDKNLYRSTTLQWLLRFLQAK